ncbi:Ig-like domain-containing protein [Aeromonas sp. 55A]|uniref:Ig-like domain-containing protein n=1 Tax=Aeromonas sp. 55A TaxID=3452720 RepID=UPI003F798208
MELNVIAGDDILNAEEAKGDVAVTGTVGGDAKEGDTVTLTIGVNTYTGKVQADNTFSINVPGSVLAANSSVNASVTATDGNGNSVTAETDRDYSVDTEAEATIELNVIAGDDILNAEEAKGDVAVTGTVGGDAKEGDTVTLTIGVNTYTGKVQADNTFSINVPGSVLAANSSVNASVTATDGNGNSVTAETDRDYSVDTEAEATIELNVIAGDDILNAEEAKGDVAVTGTVGGDAKEGDTVTLTIGVNTYTGKVQADNTFSINVPGSVLAANSSVNASVTATDGNGNSVTAETDRDYSVDTEAEATIELNVIAGLLTAA